VPLVARGGLCLLFFLFVTSLREVTACWLLLGISRQRACRLLLLLLLLLCASHASLDHRPLPTRHSCTCSLNDCAQHPTIATRATTHATACRCRQRCWMWAAARASAAAGTRCARVCVCLTV
jgi:hypothetical protein